MVNYDIDHIYPKALFSGNANVKSELKDSLCNLEILSSKANKEKNDKKLIDINDKVIKNEISKSSGIPEKEFDKYSNVSNLDALIKLRLKNTKEIFKNDRDKMLMN